jgi:hypothetical protein
MSTMLTRFHKIMIGLLVAQIALLVIVLAHGGEAGTRAPTPLLVAFDAAKVTHIQVATGDGSGSNAPLELAKHGDGWVLASAFDYPAETAKVSDLLTSLAKMAAAEPMATSAARHKQLRVADTDFVRKLVLTADGKDTTVFIGTQAGPRRATVRIAGDDRVYAVTGLSAGGGLEPKWWIDDAYVRVPKDQITKIAVQTGGHSFELSRPIAGGGSAATAPTPGPWSLALDGAPAVLAPGEKVDINAAARIANAVATIDVETPADPKRDASHPLATITLELAPADGKSPAPLVLDVLDSDQGHFWLHDRSRPAAAIVDAGALNSIVHVSRDTIVSKPPAPEHTGSGSGSAAHAGSAAH